MLSVTNAFHQRFLFALVSFFYAKKHVTENHLFILCFFLYHIDPIFSNQSINRLKKNNASNFNRKKMIGLLTILRLEIDSTYDHMLMNGLRPAKLVHILILSHLIQPVANIGQMSLVLSVLMQLLYI